MHKHRPWESSGVHLRNFSNTAEQKDLRITTQKGKEDNSFCPHHPIPQASFASRERSPQLDAVPLTRRGRAGWATSFPVSLGPIERSHSVLPQPEAGKAEITQTTRNDKVRRLPAAATWQKRYGSSGPCLGDKPAAFTTRAAVTSVPQAPAAGRHSWACAHASSAAPLPPPPPSPLLLALVPVHRA